MRPARHNFQNAISSDRERAHDLDRRAIVKGSKQDQEMLRFPMISQWTCHRPKIARKRRSAGLRPPRTGPSAKLNDGAASAPWISKRDMWPLARPPVGDQPEWLMGPAPRCGEPEIAMEGSLLSCAATCVWAPEVFEHKSCFEIFTLTCHWFSATFSRNEEHMGGIFDLGWMLGF